MRKVVRDNAVQDSTIRHESSYEYDGMRRIVRERTLKWNNTDGRLEVMQDLRTEYDLGGNPTTVYFYDNVGKAYKETRTYVLIKTIEYYRGCAMPSGSGQNLAWFGTTINSGAYVSGVRTYTYKGAGPVYYDMVYTSNARGQSEKTCFIDADDSTTRATSRFYTWRDRVRRFTHPDGNSLDYTWDDHAG